MINFLHSCRHSYSYSIVKETTNHFLLTNTDLGFNLLKVYLEFLVMGELTYKKNECGNFSIDSSRAYAYAV